jgi:hypothetical protein
MSISGERNLRRKEGDLNWTFKKRHIFHRDQWGKCNSSRKEAHQETARGLGARLTKWTAGILSARP